jgi:cell division protein FtsZ
VLINITGNTDLSVFEVNEAATLIQEEADEDATIIFGAVIDPEMGDEMRITVIATGFGVAAEKALPVQEVAEPVVAVAAVGNGMRRPLFPTGDPGRRVRRLGMLSEEGGEPVFRPYAEKETVPVEERYTLSDDATGQEDIDIPAFLRVGSK